jgi:hypothetical protein
MIGDPRLCEPLLASGLGRFTGGAREQARYRPSEKNISPLAGRLGFRRIARCAVVGREIVQGLIALFLV